PAESGLASLLGFNGERRDPVTGHYLLGNGYRAYNPVLMRFNSPDSLSPFGEGGLNAYGYVGGDPVGFGDPTGHIPFKKVMDLRRSEAYLRRVSREQARAKNPILSRMLDNKVSHDPKRIDLNVDDSSIVTPVATSSAGSSKGSLNELVSQPEGWLSQRDLKKYRNVLDTKLDISRAKTIKAMNAMDKRIQKRVDAVAKIKKHFEVRVETGAANTNYERSLKNYTKMYEDIAHDHSEFRKNMSSVRGSGDQA
ncbi:RHS repeat-associated core domain-containing protein, partial [Pseudomonas syringae]